MSTITDNGFARISKETLIRNPSTPWAITWNDIAYDETNTLNEKIDEAITIGGAHEARTDNPHSVTKSQVWLSNVDNTSDSTKNSATATLTNKTITSPVINTPTGIVKSDVGLWNVDNTTDALKPISTATQTALDGKVDENVAIVWATKTKITYDAKWLVTAGADATTADIPASTDKNYVTDAQSVVIGNTSGTNTGDQTTIVGITGTKAEYNTSVTDWDFMYVGDAPTTHTHTLADVTDVTATPSELNILDGATLSTTELNYVDGVTSAIQTQINAKANLSWGNTFTGNQTITQIDVGNTDTSITRSSAWRIAVEGATVAHQNDITQNTRQDLALALTPNYDAISGAIVLDSSKNHYHWTVSGATYIPNGWLNGWGAYDFDGVDDYIELNDGMTIKSLLVNVTTTPTWLTWKPDWTVLYITGSWAQDSIYSFTCSTSWDVDTWTLRSSFSLATWTNDPTWIKWNNDGTKAYVISNQADDIKYFTAGTAYDETTLSYVGAYSTGVTWSIFSLSISPSGTNFYFTENVSDVIYQHIMSTPWDMSTASSVRSQSVSWFETGLYAVDFKPDGTMMWIVWAAGDDVTEFSLGTAWDISTLTGTGITFYIWVQDSIYQYWIEFWDSGKNSI